VACGVVRRKGRHTGDQLVEHHSEGVQIGAMIDPPALCLLGGHILGCPHQYSGPRQLNLVTRPSDPKVRDLGPPVRGEQYVARLDVAMDHAAGVGIVQGGGQFPNDPEAFCVANPSRLESLMQGATLQMLHSNVVYSLLLAYIVDGDYVGVIEPGCRAGLSLKASQEFGLMPEVRGEYLQGDVALQGRLPGQVDNSHPATPKL
jgi:hypothetical protein